MYMEHSARVCADPFEPPPAERTCFSQACDAIGVCDGGTCPEGMSSRAGAVKSFSAHLHRFCAQRYMRS
jgi:hypothetical protein